MQIFKRHFGFCLAIAVTCLFTAGCGEKEPEPVAPEVKEAEAAAEKAPEPDPQSALFMKADELYTGGDTNGALELLDTSLDAPEFKEAKPQIFNMLVRMMLYAGKTDEARGRMLNVYSNDVELASSSFGIVYAYYAETGDSTNALDWTETVLAVPDLPQIVRRNMREWNLLGLIENGKNDKAVKVAASLVRAAPADDAASIVRRAIDMLFIRKDLTMVERILAESSKIISSDPSVQSLLLSTRLRLLAEQGKWDTLRPAFQSGSQKLGDTDLVYLLRHILIASSRAKQIDISDEFCYFIITNAPDKERTYSIAARQLIDNAAQKKSEDLPDRLEKLLAQKKQVQLVCDLYLRYFYDLIDNPAVMAEMKDLGMRLEPLAPSDEVRGAIRTIVLESCFLLEDFDSALKLLKVGIPSHDKAWHDMAIVKVEAHKALKEKRPLDAIKHFRSFMSIVAASKESDAADPTTGVVHTREMILGFNAKRIGDIYKTVPDEAKAKDAYKEARDYYNKALEAAQKKAAQDVIAVILREMSEIPQ